MSPAVGERTGAAEAATSATLYFGPWYRRSPFFERTLAVGCTAYGSSAAGQTAALPFLDAKKDIPKA